MKRLFILLIAALLIVLPFIKANGIDYNPDLTLTKICEQPISITFTLPLKPSQNILITDAENIRNMNGSRLYASYGGSWDAIPQGPHHNDGSANFTMMVGDLQVLCSDHDYDVLIYSNPDYQNLYWVVMFYGTDFGFPLINTYQTSLRDLLLSDSDIRPLAAFVTNDINFDHWK